MSSLSTTIKELRKIVFTWWWILTTSVAFGIVGFLQALIPDMKIPIIVWEFVFVAAVMLACLVAVHKMRVQRDALQSQLDDILVGREASEFEIRSFIWARLEHYANEIEVRCEALSDEEATALLQGLIAFVADAFSEWRAESLTEVWNVNIDKAGVKPRDILWALRGLLQHFQNIQDFRPGFRMKPYVGQSLRHVAK